MTPARSAREPAAGFGELALVELPALEELQALGWTHGDLMNEVPGPQNPTRRLSWREMVLPARLRAALNPNLPPEALQQAEAALTQDCSAMVPVAANRALWQLLREGVKLNELPETPYPQPVWEEKVEAVWQFVYPRGRSLLANSVPHH
jgi:type I restriction enzyme R subunit